MNDSGWRKRQIALDKKAENARELGLDYELRTSMTKDLKALIEDLRLNHEYCPKEIILQAADELERLIQPEYRAVKTFHEGKPVYVAQQEPSHIPLITDEEWAALNASE